MSGNKVKLLENLIDKCILAPKLKKFAINLTDTMHPFEVENDCMLGPEDGNLYKSIKNRIFTAPGAFERISIWQELITQPKM